MKEYYFKIKTIILLLVPALAITPNVYAAKSYLMFCRTGGGMELILTPIKKSKTNISIKFKKSKFKYDPANPQLKPGECAWKDRPLNAAEPIYMHHLTNMYIRTAFDPSRLSKPRMQVFKGQASEREYSDLVRFLNTMSNDDYFTVKVQTDYSTSFKITSFE